MDNEERIEYLNSIRQLSDDDLNDMREQKLDYLEKDKREEFIRVLHELLEIEQVLTLRKILINNYMGRYYNGDIEGKFWFGVQSSDDAEFFGGEKSEPNTINYFFDVGDLVSVESGIKECVEMLGDYKVKLDKFFSEKNGYNDEMIMSEFNISKERVKELLEWYARLELGEKILKCLQEKEECSFEAEL